MCSITYPSCPATVLSPRNNSFPLEVQKCWYRRDSRVALMSANSCTTETETRWEFFYNSGHAYQIKYKTENMSGWIACS